MRNAALMVVFALVIVSSKTLSAQTNITNDYIILDQVGVNNLSDYTTALDAANWETYRLRDVGYQLIFDTGFKIELKSASQLVAEGVILNISSYQTSLPSGYVPPVLKLLPGNVIGMQIQPTTNTKNH